ncbi:hypothetical protein [Amycolatopsis sp. VC5-11]|uniref:hypothetical protein n=1 Tax=Amycolatopsis sp. VC5-11 TaxID=3120156 RepID=UPI00300853A6
MSRTRPKTGRVRRTLRRTGQILFAAGVIAHSGAACSRAPAPSTPPNASALPVEAAAEVCARFTVAALSVDTATDTGPADARRRAAQQYGTADLENTLAGEGRDRTWTDLAARRARVHVDTEPITDDPQPSDDRTAAAGVLATATASAPDGWRQKLPTLAAYCSLTQAGRAWKVAGVSFSDSDGGA